MKNPNGYGSVYKLSGKRRKPWGAFTPAQTALGSLTRHRDLIGCYETRAEAMKALASWHENGGISIPVSAEKITLEELYNEYIKLAQFTQLSKQTQDCYSAAWLKLSVLGRYKVKDLRTAQFQGVIDDLVKQGFSHSTLHKVKVFAGLLCEYAVQTDIINKNYASFIVLPRAQKDEKIPFTDLELKKIEDAAAAGIGYADLILILCYTGWRIQEFLDLTPFSYDANNHTLTGGCKTEAGKNRTVPVSPKVQPYLDKWLAKGGPYIVCKPDRYDANKLLKVTPNYFRNFMYFPTLEKLGIERKTPHTTRHTFASLLHRAGADKWDIQRLMGHASAEVTNNVYTHVDIEQLKDAVGLL